LNAVLAFNGFATNSPQAEKGPLNYGGFLRVAEDGEYVANLSKLKIFLT
jgi:hypothetical protein